MLLTEQVAKSKVKELLSICYKINLTKYTKKSARNPLRIKRLKDNYFNANY